jgi:Fe-S-cluster containining protein
MKINDVPANMDDMTKGKNGVLEVKTQLDCNPNVKRLLQALFTLVVKCQGCAKCCNGSFFKDVPLLDDDVKAIMNKTGWSISKLKNICQCTESKGDLILHIIQPCPFLVSGRCSIYDARPTICRLFPVIIHDNLLKINISCPAGRDVYEKLMSLERD